MKKFYFLKGLFIILCIVSCSKDAMLPEPATKGPDPEAEFRFSENEIRANVVEFISEFYSSHDSKATTADLRIDDVVPVTLNSFPDVKSGNTDINTDGLLYAVNLSDGFVLAGGDKRSVPIFAYIEEGRFTKDKLSEYSGGNPGFVSYIERTLLNICDDIKAGKICDVQTKAYPIVERHYPLLGETKWGQERPYNLYCPNGKSGCAVTALAMVSSFYGSPTVVHYGPNIPENPMGAPFDLTLDWDKILSYSDSWNGILPPSTQDEVTGEAPNEAQTVALYMRYIGIITGAEYGAEDTSVETTRSIAYLRNNIGLQSTDKTKYDRDDVYNHIKGGNLVVMRGDRKVGFLKYKGHMWLADGVFKTNHGRYYFHYNWGWNGIDNGYYFDDRWDPGRREFDDDGNEVSQVDKNRDYRNNLRCMFISW